MRAPSDSALVPRTTVVTAASVEANLDALRTLSAQLNDLSRDCFDMVGTCARIQWNLPLAADALSPLTSAACSGALLTLTTAPWASLTHLGVRTALVGTLLAASVETYELAETQAGFLVGRVRRAYDSAVVLAAVVMWTHKVRSGQAPDVAATDVVAALPQAVDSVTALIDEVLPGSYERNVTVLASVAHLLTGAGVVRVSRAQGAKVKTSGVTSVTESLVRVDDLYRGPADCAYVQVQRTVDPVTKRGAWVVMVPGTKGGLGGPQPMNWRSNLDLAAGRDSDSSAAVEAALEQAMAAEGADSRKEPVMLVGHSQGGLVAAHLARKFADQKRYNVTHVVTFGSPVGRMRAPAHVQQLNIEQRQDVVPRTDAGSTGSRESNRVRVQFDDPNAIVSAEGRRGAIEPHDAGKYASTYAAWRLTQSAGSEVGRYEAGTQHFFTGDRRTYTYQATVGPPPTARPTAGEALPSGSVGSTQR